MMRGPERGAERPPNAARTGARVTIGLPVRDGERYLVEALDSLLAQTYRDFELIVSDNASTDRTEAIVRAYAEKDPRIRYYRNQQNVGGCRNHNRVVELASGDYFLWASHDDARAPGCLERCVDVLDREPGVVLCYTGSIIVDENGRRIREGRASPAAWLPRASDRFRELIRLDHDIEPVYGLIRLNVLRKTPCLAQFPDSDRVLMAELSLHGPFRRIDEPLLFRRDHAGRSTRVYPTRRRRMLWISPESRPRLCFPHARELVEYLRVVRRSPIGLGEQARSLRHVARWLVANRRRFLREARAGARDLARVVVRGRAARVV